MRIKLIFSLILVIVSLGICASANSLPSKYVLLNHSGELTDYIGRYTEANSGKTFLVIEMELENHGYDTVDINPNYFAVVIDKVAYLYDKATYSTESPLDSVVLLDGGKASGYLVFQIPEDKTKYSLVYVGQGDYEFIYGKLETANAAQESKPKVPSRNVTFTLDGKSYAFDGNSYSTRVDTSKPGYVTQITKSERSVSKGDPNPFVEVTIKTIIDDSLKPVNSDRAMQEAANSYMEAVKKRAQSNIDEKASYEATLANGDKVTVHPIKRMPFNYNNNLYWTIYMPDGNTIVTVASSENKQEFDEVLKTLNIGEMQNV